MGWFLVCCLIIMALGVYRFVGRDVSSPAFLSCIVFIISAIFFSLNATRWEAALSIETVFTILTALLVFYLGGEVKIRIVGQYTGDSYGERMMYKVPKVYILAFLLYNSFAFLMVYRRVVHIGTLFSSSEYLLGDVRTALATQDASWGTLVSVLRESSYAIGYLCLGVFLINVSNVSNDFVQKIKKNLYLLLPIIPMLLIMILSTGRTGFIRVLVVIFVVALMTYKRQKKIKLKKFIKFGCIIFAVLLVLFMYLGRLTGKSNIFDPFSVISIYVGSSIGALNRYLENPISYSNVFAGETLYGIRYWLQFLFPSMEATPVALPFSYFGLGHNTNVYTALRRYINDYGLIGMYIIQFFKGAIFCNWHRSIKRKSNNGLSLIMYAYFMYDIFLQSIEENFLREFLTIAQIFIILTFLLVYKIFFKPYKTIRRE